MGYKWNVFAQVGSILVAWIKENLQRERSFWMTKISQKIFGDVRLNLINHFFGFISCQFACNSALRNPVFRWKLCKDSVWEGVKKCSRLCTEIGTHDWISRVAHDWQAARGCTRVKHAEKLNRYASCSTTGCIHKKLEICGHLHTNRKYVSIYLPTRG